MYHTKAFNKKSLSGDKKAARTKVFAFVSSDFVIVNAFLFFTHHIYVIISPEFFSFSLYFFGETPVNFLNIFEK